MPQAHKRTKTAKASSGTSTKVRSSKEQAFTPGETITGAEPVVCNVGRKTLKLTVKNTGDRPIQIGSHTHFFEVNKAIEYKRADAFGYRLNIAAGTAVRFEPGDTKEVELTELGGKRVLFGGNALTMGSVDSPIVKERAIRKAKELGFKGA